MKTGPVRMILSIAAALIVTAGPVADAFARGQGGGGRSYSRSGPGASGSFASRGSAGARQVGATQRSAQRMSAAQTRTRQAGAGERSAQRAQTQQTRSESRSGARTSSQQERTERQSERQQGYTERTDIRQQERSERTESRTSAAQNIANDWDGHHYYDDDDDWGYALAGAAIGATAGFIAGAATATPTYVTTLPCAPTVVAVNGVSYYQCGGAWYSRGYMNGEVTYVVVPPPPGQ